MDLLYDIVDTVSDIDVDSENIRNIFNVSVLAWMLNSLTDERPFPLFKLVPDATYDYVIIGAGPAGCVMANRLSENPCMKVLLMEAGDRTPWLTEVPAAARLFLKSDVDWDYETEPQEHAAFGLRENRVPWNSGKGPGGGSLINAMLYVRGNRKNFDDWEAEGCTGWGYNDVFSHFLTLEDNRNIAELDPGYHQEGGPQTAEKVNYTPKIKKPVIEALERMGYKVVDVNGRQQTGIYDIQALFRNQRRCSASKSYLVPADTRPNLDIVKGVYATKIRVENKRAVGVEYDHYLPNQVVHARKGVIVAAGTVRSAQLLMLSGIGPSEELRKFGIDVKADLPVGRNLQDHCSSSLIYVVNDTLNVAAKSVLPSSIADYTLNRRGPLTAPSQVTVVAFTSGLNGSAVTTDFPRQELYFAEYNTLDAGYNSNLKEGTYEKCYAPYTFNPVYICYSSLLQPKSRGDIKLKSLDPYEPPLINPNYYQNEEDLRDVAEGLDLCNAVAMSQPMQSLQAELVGVPIPGCEKEFESSMSEYNKCHARYIVNSFWHPVGTARMGQPDDSRSVVDPQLRVIGIEGLRVINAAAMPIITSGNTNVPTLMLAEKAADMMKDEAKCPDTEVIPGLI